MKTITKTLLESLKDNLIDDAAKDIGIEPGSAEEDTLNSLYDREIKGYKCSSCGAIIDLITDFNKKAYLDGIEYYCPECGEPYGFSDLQDIEILEAFDPDKTAKRIARYKEFDNGHVLHSWYEDMTAEEAEELARKASLEMPDDVHYVQYDNVMNSSSNKRYVNGVEYNTDEGGFHSVNGLPVYHTNDEFDLVHRGEKTWEDIAREKMNESEEVSSQSNIPDEAYQYMFQDMDYDVDRNGSVEYVYVPTYEEFNDNTMEIDEDDFIKVRNEVEQALYNTKFYRDSEGNGFFIELSDNHTMWELSNENKNIDEWTAIVQAAAIKFENETNVELKFLGRSGRHVCVDVNVYNILNYNKLKEVQERLEQECIDEFNNEPINESTQKMSYDEFLTSEWLKDYLKAEFETSGYNEWSEFIDNFEKDNVKSVRDDNLKDYYKDYLSESEEVKEEKKVIKVEVLVLPTIKFLWAEGNQEHVAALFGSAEEHDMDFSKFQNAVYVLDQEVSERDGGYDKVKYIANIQVKFTYDDGSTSEETTTYTGRVDCGDGYNYVTVSKNMKYTIQDAYKDAEVIIKEDDTAELKEPVDMNESAETGKMTMAEYALKVKDGEFDSDVCDTEIDMLVYYYCNFKEEPRDNYEKLIRYIGEHTYIEKVNGDIVICDFTSLVKPYNEQWKEMFDMDYSEFDEDEAYYECVVNLEPIIAGNVGEKFCEEMLDIFEGRK